MHRRSLAAQERTKASNQRPTTRPSAFITRANNPHPNIKKKRSSKSPPKVQEVEKKLPEYLTFIFTVFNRISDFLYRVYLGICYVLSLPGKAYDFTLYVASLPLLFAEKCVQFISQAPDKLVSWLARNLDGLLSFAAEYHLGGLCLIATCLWFCPLPTMTYPLFSISRLVLGTLYPAYASYKAVRTKDVREYVKWMMYWIVFAIFTSIETFTDIFVAFW